MPGEYTVQSRNAGWGRAGLALPYTPTTGPLVISQKNDLRFIKMSQPWWGNAAGDQYAGCYTEDISDCSVVAIMEWESTANTWGLCYFHHVAGSDITKTEKSIVGRLFSKVKGPRFAVVGQHYGGSTFSAADELFDVAQVPLRNRSYYKSNRTGMNFGLRFVGGYFGEYLT